MVLATCKVGRLIYSYFEKSCRKKCKRQSRKVLWVVLSPLFFISSTATVSGGDTDRIPYYLSGLSRALFSDNLSRNSCILVYIAMVSSLTSVCASRQHRRVPCFGHISYRFGCFSGRFRSRQVLFAMNFERTSTFKSKWKRFWIISLKKGAKIEVTKHVLLADEPTVSAYSV